MTGKSNWGRKGLKPRFETSLERLRQVQGNNKLKRLLKTRKRKKTGKLKRGEHKTLEGMRGRGDIINLKLKKMPIPVYTSKH